MRDRLIVLIERADEECKHNKNCEDCSGFGKGEMCMNYHIADYLLANGVIVPPCKVGDTVYCIEYNTIRKGIAKEVKSLKDEAGIKFFVRVECEIENPFYSDKRKTKHGIYAVWEIVWGGWHRAFLTREKAEAALKERGKG